MQGKEIAIAAVQPQILPKLLETDLLLSPSFLNCGNTYLQLNINEEYQFMK